jgi:hypothetical protein
MHVAMWMIVTTVWVVVSIPMALLVGASLSARTS